LNSFQGRAAPAELPTYRCSSPQGAGEKHGCRKSVFPLLPPPSPGELEIERPRLRSASTTVFQRQAAVKLHRDFFSRWEIVDCSSTVMWFHRVLRGDSGALVDPFMHVELTRQGILATLRESELLPRLQALSPVGPVQVLYWPGFRAVHKLSLLRLPVFLLNSPRPLCHCDLLPSELKEQHPLYQRYGLICRVPSH